MADLLRSKKTAAEQKENFMSRYIALNYWVFGGYEGTRTPQVKRSDPSE